MTKPLSFLNHFPRPSRLTGLWLLCGYLLLSAQCLFAQQNLIPNPGFELGTGNDFTNWGKYNGAAYLTATTVAAEVHSGIRALKSAGPGFAGQQYGVQLVSDLIPTVNGASYTFKIWVKAATAGGTIRFSTQPNPQYGPNTSVPANTWTQLSWTFVANETQTRIALDLGQSNVVYYLDDMEMLAPAVNNLVSNGSFETGGPGNDFTGWSKYNGAANMTETTVAAEVYEGSRAVKVVNTVGGNAYSVQLVSNPMSLTLGNNYTATVYVRSNAGGETIRFSTNAEAGAQYGPNFTTTTTWKAMTWTFKANDASTRIVLDMGASAGTFFVDNVTVVVANDCSVKYQVPAGQTPIATGKNKFLGSIYSSAQIPNFEKYFNQVTPENSGKWGSIEGTQGVYNFTEVDRAREFAKVNGFPFRFHVLVWGSQQPTWLKPLSDAQKVQKLRDWFQAVANHYDGSSNARAKLEYIEVANETLNDPPNNTGSNVNDAGSGDYVNALKSLNAELGTTPGQYDWVINSFKLARQYFPCETKLVLNEYNAETILADEYVKLVNLLKADNLLDVIGLQAHSFSTRKYDPNQSFASHTAYLKGQLDKIAATGLPVMITELDIDGNVDETYTVTTNVAVKQAFQKAEYERIFGLYWNHPSVIGITLWGYLTGHWRSDQEAFLVDACSGQEKPALRDYLNNTLNNTPNSIRASGNPPLGTNFLPKICGIPAAARYTCASEVPASSTATITASAVNCPGQLGVTVSDATTPATPTIGNSYTITRTWTVTDACNNIRTASQLITVTNGAAPESPVLATISGQPYPAGVSSLTISQNVGNVILTVSGCQGGTISWSGGSATTLAVSTANQGTQTITAACIRNGCSSPVATATITVVAPTLQVLSRDPENGQLNNNTIKPYLLLQNVGNTSIPYNSITLRYWLTTEDNVSLLFQKNYVQLGQNNLNLRYVPLNPARQGATGYIEYSFTTGAGNLAPTSDSGPLEMQANKQNYSPFDQFDDYSYINNSSFALNPRITAYQNGVIFYGQEPTGNASARLNREEAESHLSVTVLGNPITGQSAEVEISEVTGQTVELKLVDLQGRLLHGQSIQKADRRTRVSVPMQDAQGLLILDVSTATQRQQIKLIRP